MSRLLFLGGVLCALIGLLWWFQQPQVIYPMDGVAMTMRYRVLIGDALSRQKQAQVYTVISNVFDEVNTHLNQWNPHSEISQLNRLGAGESVKLSPLLSVFLEQVDEWVHLSEGRFDPTIGPARDKWLSSLQVGTVPSAEDQDALRAITGWDKVLLKDGVFAKKHAEVQLNVDSVAKGYAVDLIHEALLGVELRNFLIEWGGEYRAQGTHPSSRPWTILIHNPLDPSNRTGLDIVTLENSALATSGDYEQQWMVPGGESPCTYCHILNPITAKPTRVYPTSIASGSVQAPTCAMADALATALLVCESTEEAEGWMKRVQKKHPSLVAWMTTRHSTYL